MAICYELRKGKKYKYVIGAKNGQNKRFWDKTIYAQIYFDEEKQSLCLYQNGAYIYHDDIMWLLKWFCDGDLSILDYSILNEN